MGFYKKTILLSNQVSRDKGMAILTIEKTNGGIFGNIKCFDIAKTSNLVLGISVDGKQVTKQNVSLINGNVFNFKLHNDFEIDGKIGCVLAEVYSGDVNVLLWGTNGAKAEYKQNIINTFKEEKETKTFVSNEQSNRIKEQSIDKERPQVVDENLSETFSPELFETDEEEVNQIIDKELKRDDFFGLIDEQVDELFSKFPLDEKLGSVVPNSKWVRVDYENNGKEYILGLIYEEGDVKYICYGVPSKFDVAPPPELQPYSQWLQLDGDDGFWVMYQDAKTGDSIIIDDVKSL